MMNGSGCPPEAIVTSNPSATGVAYAWATVQNWPLPARFMTASFSARITSAGRWSGRASEAVRTVWRASAVSAAAAAPFPHTSPMAMPKLPWPISQRS